MRRRRWVALVLAVVAVPVVLYFGQRGDADDPASLIPTRPALRGNGWTAAATGVPALDVCPRAQIAYRRWTKRGSLFEGPSASATVCAYDFELAAWSVYKWHSLASVASQKDWPNFEPWSDGAAPPGSGSVELAAEQWEVGCGLGNPAGLCQVWIFRARYGSVLSVLEYHHDVGNAGSGTRFETMRRFMRSVDSHIAMSLGRDDRAGHAAAR
jgi:hypothetical protein